MSCERFEEQVSAYIDHELRDDEAGTLFTHLGGCASCRRAMADALELRSGLREQSPLLAPKELDEKVLKMAESRRRRQPDRRAIPFIIWQKRVAVRIPLVLAISSMLILGSFLLASVWSPLGKSPPQIQTVYVTTLPVVEVRGYMP